MRSLRILGVLLAVLVLALGAGCGGDDDSDSGTTETAATTTTPAEEDGAAAATTTVSMDEYSFDPDKATVDRDDTITVENEGNIAHNLTIEKGPDPKEKTSELAATSSFLGGKSEDLKVDLDPGAYAMVCTVPGHRELGMVGTINVK